MCSLKSKYEIILFLFHDDSVRVGRNHGFCSKILFGTFCLLFSENTGLLLTTEYKTEKKVLVHGRNVLSN